jgi:hypothetical protein
MRECIPQTNIIYQLWTRVSAQPSDSYAQQPHAQLIHQRLNPVIEHSLLFIHHPNIPSESQRILNAIQISPSKRGVFKIR